jgi:hypothetical protein
MARRIINRKEKRAEFDAYERTAKEDEDQEEEEEEDGDEEAEEEAEAGDGAGDDEEAAGEGDDEDDEAPKKKKKKEPKPKAVKPKRTRVAKIVRMKVVWAVYNNSNQQVKTFEYPDRKSADEYAAKMMTDKKTTYFVQPFKKPIEEKKEE